MEDFDSDIGFWIKCTPYLWVPGETLYTSKRFYILSHDAAALFDSKNYITNATHIKEALSLGHLDSKETFSLFPIAHKKECEIVRDHFLVWVFTEIQKDSALVLTRSNGDIFPWTDISDVRIEGQRISIIRDNPSMFKEHMVNIVNPLTEYESQVSVYSSQFGDPHIHTLSAELGRLSQKGNPRIFVNIAEAARYYNLPAAKFTQIHIEAMKNAIANHEQYKIHNVSGFISELKRLGKNAPSSSWKSKNGWIYIGHHPDFGVIRNLYEIAIGKRKEYKVRDFGHLVTEKPKFVYPPVEEHARKKTLSRIISPKKLPDISPFVVLDKTATIFTTADLKKRGNYALKGNASVCFDDDPNKTHRPTMEDQAFQARLGPNVWLYAVLDGHGGKNAAEYFMKAIPHSMLIELRTAATFSFFDLDTVTRAVKNAFFAADSRWFHRSKQDKSGTTFTGVLITSRNIFTINLGDSRTIILRDSPSGESYWYTTTDHKPSDPIEKARIKAAGSYVFRDRVGGYLAVARALGDNDHKVTKGSIAYLGEKAPVSPIPDVTMYKRENNELILIACDGVFDVMSNDEAVKIFSVNESCRDIVQEAISRGTTDNVTAMGLKVTK